MRWLQQQGCEQIYFKYCSTFDSTAQGNIGPVTDSLLAALAQDITLLCPALPVNGRTVYHGYLFVNGVPLNGSGMRNHPVTPMRYANVMRLMEAQAAGRAANIPFCVIDAGVEAVQQVIADLRQAGYRYLVPDALTSTHLETIAEASQTLPLLTGGSGLAGGLAAVLTRGSSSRNVDASEAGKPADGGKTVILSGSCYVMTNAQVAAYAAEAPALPLDVACCIEGLADYVAKVTEWVCQHRWR
ncbi:MAG: four-carbon acid sugar kinase family protein [Candidatus Symbiopectobacterium sp. PLON1]|nr:MULTISPECIES: four-carbon acid sugar kinase family protein [Symbiopectobacterium]MBG6248346.1 four-carbon acid sugar kinase family protein [Candidatus Symbiopectobacterium sp. PLON1]